MGVPGEGYWGPIAIFVILYGAKVSLPVLCWGVAVTVTVEATSTRGQVHTGEDLQRSNIGN